MAIPYCFFDRSQTEQVSREQSVTQKFHFTLLYHWRHQHEISYARPKKSWQNKLYCPSCGSVQQRHAWLLYWPENYKSGQFRKQGLVVKHRWMEKIAELRPTWIKTGLNNWKLLQCQMMFSGKGSPRLARVPLRQLEAIRARRWWGLWPVQGTAPSKARFGRSTKGMSSSQGVKPPCRGVRVLSWPPGNQFSCSTAGPDCRTSALTSSSTSLCSHISFTAEDADSQQYNYMRIYMCYTWKWNSFCWVTELIIIMCIPQTHTHTAPACGLVN